MTYLIEANVTGGVTGTRTAYLKRNGEIWRFTSYEAARQEADRLNREMNAPYSTARGLQGATHPDSIFTLA